jgi:hypothetical protein
MRIAHIIMTHKNPNQLTRLIKRLHHPQFDFYIHVDNKIPIDDFKSVLDIEQVSFIKNRITCNWGGNSFLQAIVGSVKEVLSLNKEYDFINLLSAQDYPLTSAENIYQYFTDKIGMNFISYEDSHDSVWLEQAIFRYEKYHFTDFSFKWKYLAQKVLNQITPSRKFPLPMKLYGGSKSSWWTISKESAIYLTEILTDNLKLNRFLKYSWGTDEFVLTTLLMNSPFKDRTVNNNLRYIDWSEGNAHPKLLLAEDFESIKSSNMIFARKFDQEIDPLVLDKIDNECLA